MLNSQTVSFIFTVISIVGHVSADLKCKFEGDITKYPFLDYSLYSNDNSTFGAFEQRIEQFGSYIVKPDDVADSDRLGYDDLVPQHDIDNDINIAKFIVMASNEASIVEAMAYADQLNVKWRLHSAKRSHEWVVEWAFCADCIIINLSDLDYVSPVSSADNMFTVESGVTMEQIIPHLKPFGVVTPVPNGKTITFGGMPQGGGFGFYTRKYGAPMNWIRTGRVIMNKQCDYAVITVDKDTNNDLFWALKGGSSGPWGIVTQWTIEGIVPTNTNAEYYRWRYQWAQSERDTFPIENILRYYRDSMLDDNNPDFTLHLLISGGLFRTDASGNLTAPTALTLMFRWVCNNTPQNCQQYKDDITALMAGRSVIEERSEVGDIWDATLSPLAPDRDRGRPTNAYWCIEAWSDDDIAVIADEIRTSFDIWTDSGTASWNIWYRGTTNNMDIGNKDTSFVFNKFANLVEVVYAPKWAQDSVQSREIINGYATGVREDFTQRGWYYGYVNSADYTRDFNDAMDPWERDYFGADIDGNIIKRLKKVKGKYDCDGYFNSGFPIQDDKCVTAP